MTGPLGESRADVEMGNDEDEETLGSSNSGVRMNPKNPTSKEKQEHEDSGHALCRSWCVACVEGRGWWTHRSGLLEEKERTTPIEAFDYGFLTQEQTRFRLRFVESDVS